MERNLPSVVKKTSVLDFFLLLTFRYWIILLQMLKVFLVLEK